MSKQLLIYENVTPLNRVEHRDMSVRQTNNFAFASETNSVPLVDLEFVKAGSEMPIVFAETETGVVCLALLGTEQDKNAFVDKDNNWGGTYVPAFFRRYPFVFAVQDDGEQLTLCVDESYDGINTDGVGERLFDAEGTETSYIKTVLQFAEEYQATFNRTQAFCDRLVENDLLEEARIDYTLNDGKTGGVTGFKRVSVEKFRALSDEKVLELFRSGDLDLIQMHMMSMAQVEALVGRTAQKMAEEDAASEAEDAPKKKKNLN